MRQRVGYDLFHRLICNDHYEHGPLECCPFPGCPNGTEQDEIEAQVPGLSVQAFRRFQWTKPQGHPCYSWVGEDRDLWYSIKRVLWREAGREGLTKRYESPLREVIYHYTS